MAQANARANLPPDVQAVLRDLELAGIRLSDPDPRAPRPPPDAGANLLPQVPPLMRQPSLRNPPPRPEDAMAPVSQMIADTLASAPAGGYRGGELLAEGAMVGSWPTMAEGGATMAMSMIPSIRRAMQLPRSGPPSEIGHPLLWAAPPAAVLGGLQYGATPDDPGKIAIATGLGAAGGFGARVPFRQREIYNYVPPSRPSPPPPPSAPPAPSRGRLVDRMRDAQGAVPQAPFSLGPLGHHSQYQPRQGGQFAGKPRYPRRRRPNEND